MTDIDINEADSSLELSLLKNKESNRPHLIVSKMNQGPDGKIMRLFAFDDKGFGEHKNGIYLYFNTEEVKELKDYFNKNF